MPKITNKCNKMTGQSDTESKVEYFPNIIGCMIKHCRRQWNSVLYMGMYAKYFDNQNLGKLPVMMNGSLKLKTILDCVC
jgi:hypothetical protein